MRSVTFGPPSCYRRKNGRAIARFNSGKDGSMLMMAYCLYLKGIGNTPLHRSGLR